MKKLFFLATILVFQFLSAQVGINTTSPNAQLEIAASNQATPANIDGIIIPKVDTFPATNPTAAQQGMMVYLTTTAGTNAPGFYYWDNPTTSWIGILDSNAKGWQLTGNAGTDATTNFLGTTDDIALNFRVNNQKAGHIGNSADNTTFFGYQAGNSNANSSYANTGIGYKALFSNTFGYWNTANGYMSLSNNTTGNSNTANGYQSLFNNTTGNNNTASGYQSLYNNTTGSYNIAMGLFSLYSNTTGNWNTAIGQSSLYFNTTGYSNTATGFHCLLNNTTGYWNTATGNRSMYNNTTGNSNTAVGERCLFSNTTGSLNTAMGLLSLYSNTTGNSNTASGYQSLYYNTTGVNNTASGYQSLYNNTTGDYNVANGLGSLYSNTTGSWNTAIGQSSLYDNSTGYSNTANGFESLRFNNAGYWNTATGNRSMYFNTTGISNTAIGDECLYNNSTGSYNTALGYAAYYLNNYSNATAIGNSTVISASNQVRLGNSSVLSIGGFASWTNVSDKRFKKDINYNAVPGLAFIQKLKPVTYHLDIDAIASFQKMPEKCRNKESEVQKSNILQTGFIAQEVEQAARELNYNFSGVDAPKNSEDYYGLRYAEFVVPLVKAVQEQQVIIEKQNDTIKQLEKRLEALENKK